MLTGTQVVAVDVDPDAAWWLVDKGRCGGVGARLPPAFLPVSLRTQKTVVRASVLVWTGDLPTFFRIRVRVDIIGHARKNMYINLSHAWL